MGRTRILFILYSYRTKKYLFPQLYLTGDWLVSSVAIIFCGPIILVKNWLDCVSNFSIGSFSGGVGSGVIFDWVFFLVCFICLFTVTMDGGRCCISSTVRLVHVANYPSLMECRGVWRTELNSLARWGWTSPRGGRHFPRGLLLIFLISCHIYGRWNLLWVFLSILWSCSWAGRSKCLRIPSVSGGRGRCPPLCIRRTDDGFPCSPLGATFPRLGVSFTGLWAFNLGWSGGKRGLVWQGRTGSPSGRGLGGCSSPLHGGVLLMPCYLWGNYGCLLCVIRFPQLLGEGQGWKAVDGGIDQ